MSAAHRWLSKVASHVLEAPPQDVESALHGQEAVNAFLNGASPNRLLLYYQPAEGVRRGPPLPPRSHLCAPPHRRTRPPSPTRRVRHPPSSSRMATLWRLRASASISSACARGR